MRNLKRHTPPQHHQKLYVGYVQQKHEIENRLEDLGHEIVTNNLEAGDSTYSELRSLKDAETYAVNGVYLHEWYFEILGGDGKFENARELVDAISRSYGSVDRFIKYFSECAISARGWTVLAWNTRESRLWIYNSDSHNHGAVWGALPIIVLDVYEHAYCLDYDADRRAYVRAFWNNLNWTAANDLFKRASMIRL